MNHRINSKLLDITSYHVTISNVVTGYYNLYLTFPKLNELLILQVGGIVITNRPDSKNAQYQQCIKQGDILLNRLVMIDGQDQDEVPPPLNGAS